LKLGISVRKRERLKLKKQFIFKFFSGRITNTQPNPPTQVSKNASKYFLFQYGVYLNKAAPRVPKNSDGFFPVLFLTDVKNEFRELKPASLARASRV
jgi:hypothetical protein